MIAGYSSRETFPLGATYSTAPEDWEYLHYPQQYNSIGWRPIGGDDLVETVIKRDDASLINHFQTIFMTNPDLEEVAMGGIFPRPAPSNSHV